MTHEEEENLIKRFKEMYSDFPNGQLLHPDRPDFILIANDKKIGIETTQVVHSDTDKRISSEKMLFIDIVLAKLTPLLPFNFILTIDLFTENGIRKSNKEEIATEVANFCASEFMNLKNLQHADVDHIDFDFDSVPVWLKNDMLSHGHRNLPKGIKSISIFRYDGHESFNPKSEAAAIPRFSKERLDIVIKDKEIKRQKYETCDEYWLIIWQGGGITGYFGDIDFDIPISTVFDKVFILRSIQNDLLTLK